MNQIILIGEVKKVVKLSEYLEVSIVSKDYQKANVELIIIVENGYQNEMVQILRKKPFIAVKCGLRVNKEISFIAEKMSVLKLTEEESKES
jgi:hypothetical protein